MFPRADNYIINGDELTLVFDLSEDIRVRNFGTVNRYEFIKMFERMKFSRTPIYFGVLFEDIEPYALLKTVRFEDSKVMLICTLMDNEHAYWIKHHKNEVRFVVAWDYKFKNPKIFNIEVMFL